MDSLGFFTHENVKMQEKGGKVLKEIITFQEPTLLFINQGQDLFFLHPIFFF